MLGKPKREKNYRSEVRDTISTLSEVEKQSKELEFASRIHKLSNSESPPNKSKHVDNTNISTKPRPPLPRKKSQVEAPILKKPPLPKEQKQVEVITEPEEDFTKRKPKVPKKFLLERQERQEKEAQNTTGSPVTTEKKEEEEIKPKPKVNQNVPWMMEMKNRFEPKIAEEKKEEKPIQSTHDKKPLPPKKFGAISKFEEESSEKKPPVPKKYGQFPPPKKEDLSGSEKKPPVPKKFGQFPPQKNEESEDNSTPVMKKFGQFPPPKPKEDATEKKVFSPKKFGQFPPPKPVEQKEITEKKPPVPSKFGHSPTNSNNEEISDHSTEINKPPVPKKNPPPNPKQNVEKEEIDEKKAYKIVDSPNNEIDINHQSDSSVERKPPVPKKPTLPKLELEEETLETKDDVVKKPPPPKKLVVESPVPVVDKKNEELLESVPIQENEFAIHRRSISESKPPQEDAGIEDANELKQIPRKTSIHEKSLSEGSEMESSLIKAPKKQLPKLFGAYTPPPKKDVDEASPETIKPRKDSLQHQRSNSIAKKLPEIPDDIKQRSKSPTENLVENEEKIPTQKVFKGPKPRPPPTKPPQPSISEDEEILSTQKSPKSSAPLSKTPPPKPSPPSETAVTDEEKILLKSPSFKGKPLPVLAKSPDSKPLPNKPETKSSEEEQPHIKESKEIPEVPTKSPRTLSMKNQISAFNVEHSKNDHQTEVDRWLESIGYSKYIPNFKDNDVVEMDVVLVLTNEEMQKDLGISSFGDRKKIFLAIENLKASPSPPVVQPSIRKKEELVEENTTETEESNPHVSEEEMDFTAIAEKRGRQYRMSILSPSEKGLQKKITVESDKSKTKKGGLLKNIFGSKSSKKLIKKFELPEDFPSKKQEVEMLLQHYSTLMNLKESYVRATKDLSTVEQLLGHELSEFSVNFKEQQIEKHENVTNDGLFGKIQIMSTMMKSVSQQHRSMKFEEFFTNIEGVLKLYDDAVKKINYFEAIHQDYLYNNDNQLKYEDVELKYENLVDFMKYIKTCRNETYPNHIKSILDVYHKTIAQTHQTLKFMEEEAIKTIEKKEIPKQITIKERNRVYGLEFEDVIEKEKTKKLYPRVFPYLLEYLFVHATTQVHVFKIQPPNEEIARLKILFDHGKFIDLTEYKNIHAIASMLKLLFLELPTPILTFDLYNEFVQVPEGHEEKMKHFRELIGKLPIVKKYCFQQLLSLLHQISLNSTKNKMDSDELAKQWGIILLRNEQKNPEIAANDLNQIQTCVSYLIKTYPILKDYFVYEEE
eukprot:gene8267-92_t